MRTRPVEDGWIHVEMDRSTGEQLISSLTIEQGIVPDVEGMGLKDAVYLLENEGKGETDHIDIETVKT